MNVKIAMHVAASEYERLTLDEASPSPMAMPPQFLAAWNGRVTATVVGAKSCCRATLPTRPQRGGSGGR